jgi:NDP-sugar pyrophosphorylase family protein
MKALVLSAGYGERLRPLTDTIPKPLLELGGRPLIHYPLLMLRHAGITEIAINVHHLASHVERALGSGSALGISITYSPETVLLGTGGPLLALRDYFGGDAFVMLNCDTVMDLALTRLIDFHRAHRPLATFVVRDGGNPDAYSRIELGPDFRIRRMRLLTGRARDGFADYPASIAPEVALTPYMYCGAMICEPDVFTMMPTAPPFSLMADLFAPIAARGVPLMGYVHRGLFRTVDDLAGYETLRAEFAAAPPRLGYLLC